MRKVYFITGTRADFGKMKSLIYAAQEVFDVTVLITGMHLMEAYGETWHEVANCGFSYKKIYPYNFLESEKIDDVLINTISAFSHELVTDKPDLIVVHGDRIEALAGAMVGAFNGIPVAHIEGGEVSGSIDESIRHAVTKFSHIHFVSNQEAASRVRWMGESNIHIIGSPDVDIMLSELPSLYDVKNRYSIQYPFNDYYILLYHPVFGEKTFAKKVVDAVISSDENFIAIYPNNDQGSKNIIIEYNRLDCVFPSIRFEYFLVLLKNSKGIVGNSSCGLMEAPYFGVPTLNIGSRQTNRLRAPTVIDCDHDHVLEGIRSLKDVPRQATNLFGEGDSAEKFIEALTHSWPETQKVYADHRQA